MRPGSVDTADSRARAALILTRWGRAALAIVLVIAAVTRLGWFMHVREMTRLFTGWPPMRPWVAFVLAVLAVAVWAQSGAPSKPRIWLGRGLAAAIAAIAAAFLFERITGRSLGADMMWLRDVTREDPWTSPDRPSPRGGTSLMFLSLGIGLIRVDRRWVRVIWPVLLLGALISPVITIIGHMFKAVSEVTLTSSTGQGPLTAICMILLVGATVVSRSDRSPVAWLIERPDRWSLLRLGLVVAGLPILVGLWRLPFLALDLGSDAAWILSTACATLGVGVVAFYLSQREQGLMLDREHLSDQRAEAEARYRILADNAVDVIVHLRGDEIAWISPSVQGALGQPPQRMIGAKFWQGIHPDDVELVAGAMERMTAEKPSLQRFRLRAADGRYHWVEGHGKPYVDSNGNIDGVISALRVVDDKVEAEQRLEHLARYDTLTGLVNRAEAIARFNAALQSERPPGVRLGVAFCDIDQFKTLNDTFGHLAGDVVLSTVAARIRVSVRDGDTVGRLGGDEILVLLNGVHDLDEVVAIAEKIRRRVDEPIHFSGQSVRATLSIGVTLADPGESVYSMMARADVAMYAAKRAGRNTVNKI